MGNLERPKFEASQYDQGVSGGHGLWVPDHGRISLEAQVHVNSLIETIKEDSLSRVSSDDARMRVINGLERTLRPYFLEASDISEQITTPEYNEFLGEIEDYLGCRIAGIACPDGRIIYLQLAPPRSLSLARRLGGIPATRKSTRDKDTFLLDDPDIQASMAIDFKKRKDKGADVPETAEFMGGHIFSSRPVEDGCGYLTKQFIDMGRAIDIAMKNGGQDLYYRLIGDAFHAFEDMAKRLGGKATTFDLTHDAYSQGIILGLKDQIQNLDPNRLLRGNLIELHSQNKILATEFLVDSFNSRILEKAREMGVEGFLDVTDPGSIGRNAMIIGRVALQLAKEEESKGFPWMPDVIKDDKSVKAIRAAAFVALYNTTYITLGHIVPGAHLLQQHPERLSRIGPIGADYNVREIPFIMHSPDQKMGDEDLEHVDAIHELSHGVAKYLGVDLTTQGRVILITGEYDPNKDDYEALERENSKVGNNAAKVRGRFEDAVANGELIVTGALFNHNREVTYAVK